MLVIFKSKAAAEVIMYEEHARRILDLLHKDVKRGVITAAESGGAIATLEQAIASEQASRAADSSTAGSEPHGNDERTHNHVSFATRVFPLLDMLRAAHKRGNDVMWGV